MSWSLEEAISYYKNQGAPENQSAVISLLREVQQENGGSIPVHTLAAAAEALGVKDSFLNAIVKRIPSLRLSDMHCLELCAGPNCGKHTALAAFAERLQNAAPGKFTVKYVPCMRMCGKGPNIKWDAKVYHQANEALLRSLIEKDNHERSSNFRKSSKNCID